MSLPGLPPDGAVARLLEGRPEEGIEWGLERTERILAEVGDPHRSYRVLHVGGTNGKGSVAACAAAVLAAAGSRSGAYLSPHVVDFRERVQAAGRPVEVGALERAAERLRAPVRAAGASRFEAITALGFLTLAEVGVEVAAVEVGLGGRLDATNVVSPLAVAVTGVGRDHVEWLGESLEEIAAEKAGIVKPGAPLVLGPLPPEAERVLGARAAEVGVAPSRFGEEARVSGVVPGRERTRFRYHSSRWPEGVPLSVSLLGAHQAANAGLALALLEAAGLEFDARSAREGLGAVRHPGRFELARRGSGWRVADVAHNPAGIEALLQALDALRLPRPRVAVVSVLADKPWREMLAALRAATDGLVATAAPSAPPGRRWSLEEVEEELGAAGPAGAEVRAELPDALSRADELAGAGTVIVTGSTRIVGDVLRGDRP